MIRASIDNFVTRDLTQPESYRFQNHLAGLINFYLFEQEQATEYYEPLQAEDEELERKEEESRARVEELRRAIEETRLAFLLSWAVEILGRGACGGCAAGAGGFSTRRG